MPPFELQGHRGARGNRPENTLPSFEFAIDAGVSSIETDLQLTRDGQLVLFHDSHINPQLCRRQHDGVPPPQSRPLVHDLSLSQLQSYSADLNPDSVRFPDQDASPTPLAARLVEQPFAIPTLEQLFRFVEVYAAPGSGKTPEQCQRARQLTLDIELKRFPFHPEWSGGPCDDQRPGLLEKTVARKLQERGMVERCRVRSFDHRSVRWLCRTVPGLVGVVLVEGTAPIEPAALVRSAGAQLYGPDHQFLDESQVRSLHAEGIGVIPWTVNDPLAWRRLREWGVDGITTDFPERFYVAG